MSHTLPSDHLLLCIDMQPVFVRAIADGATVQRRCALAVAASQGLGLPVIFSEQVPAKLGGTAEELRSLAPDAPAIAKDTFSALAAPEIHAAVAAHRPRHLLLCGLETSICVFQTALAAREASMEVTVLSDAVGARRPADAQVCLAELARHGVHVRPVESVFYVLVESVQHPFFKTYTQLVKSHG